MKFNQYMKEKQLSFKNFSSSKPYYTKKDPQLNHSLNNNTPDPFSFTIHTFRNQINNDPHHPRAVLDSFNNLSSTNQQQSQNNSHAVMKCQKVFKRGDSEFSLPKFSSIQSGQTSINNSFFQDQIIAINEKSRYECDDQYSFNGDETGRNSFAQKNTHNKSKYQNLIQKIDHFLVKDFNEDNTQNIQSCTKSREHQLNLQQKNEFQKLGDFKKHERRKSQRFTQILQQESTVRQKLDFLSTYAESLEQENKKLKIQMMELQDSNKKIQQLEKSMSEKNIVIQFLTKELEKSNKKQLKKEDSNKENKALNNNIQKMRNTVSAVNIIGNKEKNPPKYRASHHVETRNQQCNSTKVQNHKHKELSQGISGDSYNSKSKSNSFMKKIFRKSHENRNNASNNQSKLKHQNQDADGYLIQILKEENSILSTKLNILYQDFQQIIEKYNQVLTQKYLCKAQCCKKLNKHQHNYQEETLLINQSHNLNSHRIKATQDENGHSLRQIRSILGQITNHHEREEQNKMSYQHTQQIEGNEDNDDQLFSIKDIQILMKGHREESLREEFSSSNRPIHFQTDRNILISEARKNISEFDQIKKSLKSGQNYRFSMQAPQNPNISHGQRFSTLVNTTEQMKRVNATLGNYSDLRVHQRQKIAPRESNRQDYRQRVKSWGIK